MQRPAERFDLRACAILAVASGRGGGADERFWHDAFARDIEDPRRHLVVGVRDEAVVGYGRTHFFEPEPDAPRDRVPRGYYLVGLFIHPGHRRMGLGSELTAARLAWIREQSDEAWFFANARNTASIELHARFGFVEVTRQFSFPRLTFAGGEGILFRLRF